MKKVLVPVSIAALLLAGCSSESSDEAGSTPAPSASSSSTSPSATPSPEPTTLAPGSFTFAATDGGVGTLDVPGTPDPEIEAMRVEVGAPEVTYLTGNFDNRDGAEEFLINSVTVYDADGNAYEYARAKDYVFDLLPDTANPKYDEYTTFYDSVDSSKIAPLQRANFVMVGPELPAEIAGIVVSNGFEDIPVDPK